MTPKTSKPEAERTFPLSGAKEGHLLLGHGMGAHAMLAAADSRDALLAARFRGDPPTISQSGGRIEMRYSLLPKPWLAFRPFGADLRLAPGVPWTIDLAGGVSQSRLDLRGLELLSLSAKGGLSRADVILPKPKGIVPVRVAGGVHRLRVERPRGVAVRVEVRGGATRVALDDARFGAVGGELRWASHGAEVASDRYDLTILGGVATLDVAEVG